MIILNIREMLWDLDLMNFELYYYENQGMWQNLLSIKT